MRFARDSFDLKTHTPHRDKEVNFLLLLEAARVIYPAREFKTFKTAMDASFRDSNYK
jgi:hypothetical protein